VSCGVGEELARCPEQERLVGMSAGVIQVKVDIKASASARAFRDGPEGRFEACLVEDVRVELEDRAAQLGERLGESGMSPLEVRRRAGGGALDVLTCGEEALDGVVVEVLGEDATFAVFGSHYVGQKLSSSPGKLGERLCACVQQTGEQRGRGSDPEEVSGLNCHESDSAEKVPRWMSRSLDVVGKHDDEARAARHLPAKTKRNGNRDQEIGEARVGVGATREVGEHADCDYVGRGGCQAQSATDPADVRPEKGSDGVDEYDRGDDVEAGAILAAASAVALNWGFFAQHAQATKLPPLTLRRSVHSLGLLFSDLRWLVGFLVGIGGWVLYVAALAFGPLSFVQATSAAGIGILALLVWRSSGIRLSAREWVGVWLSVGGLAVLGLSLLGRGTDDQASVSHSGWVVIAIWMAGSALIAGLFARPLRRALAAGAGYGVGAGLLYAAGDVGTKAALGGGARLAFVPALPAAHGLAFILLQIGFQRGSALATAGVAALFTNAVPIAAGMIIFHETMPPGGLGALRILAFATTVTGAALLTRAAPGATSALAAAPRIATDP
jgi:hypothetical protein